MRNKNYPSREDRSGNVIKLDSQYQYCSSKIIKINVDHQSFHEASLASLTFNRVGLTFGSIHRFENVVDHNRQTSNMHGVKLPFRKLLKVYRRMAL